MGMDHGTGETGVTRRSLLATAAATAAVAATGAETALASGAARDVPARSLPVPATVSPALQAFIGAPLAPGWDTIPTDAAGWQALVAASVEAAAPLLPEIKSRLGVTVTADTIAGIPVFRCDPAVVAPADDARLLLHLHGGGYVLFPGEAGAGEGMLMAGYGGLRVVSVDYRMPPDHPFPAALDDAVAVWKALLADHDPGRMAVFGSSAGGGLTLALMLRLKAAGLPLPAAIAPGTPWIDLTFAGDTARANAFVDNVLVSPTGWVGAAAPLYAGGHPLDDPLVSPVFGDFAGLPPAILTSGTRDLLLSDTVRAHRRLRRSGVEAHLQVFEGMSHAQFLDPFVPETEEAFAEIAGFLRPRLAP
jgi:acetyl esterase/lipase